MDTGIPREDLFHILRENGAIHPMKIESRKILYNYLASHLHPNENHYDISAALLNFCFELDKKWKKCKRAWSRFSDKHSVWLKQTIHISKLPENKEKRTTGRPTKLFENSSIKTKKRKLQNLIDSHKTEELTLAARFSLISSGKRDAAQIVQQATESSPTRATKMKKILVSPEDKNAKFSAVEALALIIDLDLSKHQYNSLRQKVIEKGVDLFPSYDSIKTEKQNCYPRKGDITISESSAEIKLQSLLDITTNRLILDIKDNTDVEKFSNHKLEFIHKWGFDGSSGQTSYKQKFHDDGISDTDLLLTSLVPLQLNACQENSTQTFIVWKNPRPSSTKYCRPIRFQFKKETKTNSEEEIGYMMSQINNLISTTVLFNGVEFIIHHKLLFTMVDGKVCNTLTNTSSQTCYICGATPKIMNCLEAIEKRVCDESRYEFGLSVLHAYIRFFECLIHISYRLEVKKWQIKTKEEKVIVEKRKKHIQDRFRKEMGLLIDQPKQGTGNTNDGNTARRFFNNYEKTAEITGIDINLVKKFNIILQVLSSGFPTDTRKFEYFTKETAQLYISLYNWYNMPASVHKILMHGADVIKSLMLPIGQLSEDVQESRNKDYKNCRLYHTRKNSRICTNEDLLNRLIISSDPIVSGIRRLPPKKSPPYSSEVLAFFIPDSS